MARLFGVHVAHFRTSLSQSGKWVTAVQGDGKGYPDLTMVGRNGVMFRELKSAKGTHYPEQVVWLQKLKSAGADADTWRPEDLLSGRIEKELRALSGHTASAALPSPVRKVRLATARKSTASPVRRAAKNPASRASAWAALAAKQQRRRDG